MGKKGAKGKGKPVVMTQAEFFQSTSSSGGASVAGLFARRDEEIKSDWEKGNIFVDRTAPKGAKVVKAISEEAEIIIPSAINKPTEEKKQAEIKQTVVAE